MASRKRRRGSGGHPAKVAERRSRKRGARDDSPERALRRLVSTVCEDARRCEVALEAELLASELLGAWWPERIEIEGDDPDLEFGSALVEEIGRRADPGALAALIAIAEVSGTDLGLVAREHAERLRSQGVTQPAWAEAIEETTIVRAAVMLEDLFDDGRTIFVEATHGDGEPHVVGVYIDNNLGGIAKDVLLADSIERVEEVLRESGDDNAALHLEPIDRAEAGARILNAVELTDMTIDAPVGDDFARLRSLALRRAYELPFGAVDTEPPEVSAEDRDRVFEEFLASPEAEGLTPGSDAADVVSLAIDFCSDYVDGRPLRWSPVVVELFVAHRLPRKVLADGALFEAVPAALEAWVRYAGRRRGIPGWAIERTTDAIPECVDEMHANADDPAAAGPAKEFIAAAQGAGVDLGDEEAVGNFVAGWNARSDAA